MSDFEESGGNRLVRRHSSIRLRSDNVKESDKEANFVKKGQVFQIRQNPFFSLSL